MTLETNFQRFNTRQLFRPIGYSSVVSCLRFGAKPFWIGLLVSRSQDLSPILKNEKSYLRSLDSDSIHVMSAMVLTLSVTRISLGPK